MQTIKNFKHNHIIKIEKASTIIKNIPTRHARFLNAANNIENAIYNILNKIESIQEKLIYDKKENLDNRVSFILLNSKDLFEQYNALKKEWLETKAVINQHNDHVFNLNQEINFTLQELRDISQNFIDAEAMLQINKEKDDDDHKKETHKNGKKTKIFIPNNYSPLITHQKKQEVANESPRINEIKAGEEKKEFESNLIHDQFALHPENWTVMPSGNERLIKDFADLNIREVSNRFQKKRGKKKPEEHVLQEQRALLTQYFERLHAFLVIPPEQISTHKDCLPAAILYQTFKFSHALDVLIKMYKDRHMSTDDVNFFENDPFLKRANEIRNLLRHLSEHGFSARFFNNPDPEKINTLINTLKELISFFEHSFKPSKKLKNIDLKNNDKITFNLEELLDCQPLDFQSKNIISPGTKKLAKENVDYALNILVSIHKYIYKNPQKKDLLLREAHHIPACIKMMMLLVRDGLKNLKDDGNYKKFTALLIKQNVQQTTFNVLTDFMAHDAAASESAFLTVEGELDTFVEDISKDNILDVLRSAETYQTCFNQAFNSQNNNRPIRIKRENNNNNQNVHREAQPLPPINAILSSSCFKSTPKRSNLEEDDKKQDNDFKIKRGAQG